MLRSAVGLYHHGARRVVADPLAIPRAEDGDEAHQAEEQGVDDQQDAADEELRDAGRTAVLADDPNTEELHTERLAAVAVRPDDPVPVVDGQRDDRGQHPAEGMQDRKSTRLNSSHDQI